MDSQSNTSLTCLQRSDDNVMRTTLQESSSVLSTCIDNYGEEDASLQCYQSGKRAFDLSSSSCNMSTRHADDLLEERMAEFGCDKELCISRSGNRTLFDVNSKLSIRLRIRKNVTEDVVMISVVVHNLNTLNPLHNEKHHQLRGRSYSLMTKMMKHNAALMHATWGVPRGSHIDLFDGEFWLFADVTTSILSNKRKLDLVLNEFVSKASEISKDFSQTQASIQSKLQQRRRLIKAYNRTLISNKEKKAY